MDKGRLPAEPHQMCLGTESLGLDMHVCMPTPCLSLWAVGNSGQRPGSEEEKG